LFAVCASTTKVVTIDSSSVTVGCGALQANTSGACNVAIGQQALACNTSGQRNTAIGFQALVLNTFGYKNTAIGTLANSNNTTGKHNSSVGYQALNNNTTGSYQVAIGTGALKSNTTGAYNVALGSSSLYCNTFGNGNVAIGRLSLYKNTSSGCNTAIGYRSNYYLNGANSTIAIGKLSATSNTTGHTAWGTSANNVCNCIWLAFAVQSDARDKTNVETLDTNLGLGLIKKLRPVSFNWDNRDNYVRECGYEYGEKDGTLVGEKKHYGLIAQELKGTLEELNVKFDALGHDAEKDSYRITYEELIAPIIKAIQEIDARVTALEQS
jgi:hypothetical protein